MTTEFKPGDVRPITPDEVSANKISVIPFFVLESVNEMITRAWDGKSSQFRQDDLIDAILGRWPETDGTMKSQRKSQLFEKHWLDFESLYEVNGWKVEYDKPGYNESYPATFTFRRGNEKR